MLFDRTRTSCAKFYKRDRVLWFHSATACCLQLCQRVGVLCEVVFPRQRVKRSCISGAACCSKLHVLRQRGGELYEFTLLLRRVLQGQRDGVLFKIAIARGVVVVFQNALLRFCKWLDPFFTAQKY